MRNLLELSTFFLFVFLLSRLLGPIAEGTSRVCYSYRAVVFNWGTVLCYGNTWQYFECHNWGRTMLLASSGKRPRMLLNIQQCIRQPYTTKNYLTQNVNSAEAEKPWHKLSCRPIQCLPSSIDNSSSWLEFFCKRVGISVHDQCFW